MISRRDAYNEIPNDAEAKISLNNPIEHLENQTSYQPTCGEYFANIFFGLLNGIGTGSGLISFYWLLISSIEDFGMGWGKKELKKNLAEPQIAELAFALTALATSCVGGYSSRTNLKKLREQKKELAKAESAYEALKKEFEKKVKKLEPLSGFNQNELLDEIYNIYKEIDEGRLPKNFPLKGNRVCEGITKGHLITAQNIIGTLWAIGAVLVMTEFVKQPESMFPIVAILGIGSIVGCLVYGLHVYTKYKSDCRVKTIGFFNEQNNKIQMGMNQISVLHEKQNEYLKKELSQLKP